MAEHVYKLIDLVGSSDVSVSDAIQNAITRAAATVRNIRVCTQINPLLHQGFSCETS